MMYALLKQSKLNDTRLHMYQTTKITCEVEWKLGEFSNNVPNSQIHYTYTQFMIFFNLLYS